MTNRISSWPAPQWARQIRSRVRKNMANFLGHREFPLNENTVRAANREWVERILASPETHGEALVEAASFKKRYYENHGEARHINTPSQKLIQIMAKEGAS